MTRKQQIMALVLVSGAMIAATGCAGKKYVNERIDPVSQRVESLEAASSQQARELDEIGNHASRADERAVSAGQRADEAMRGLSRAEQEASRANRAATEAKSEAESALTGLDELERRVDGINDYELVSRHTILFGLESSELTEEAEKTLAKVADDLVLDVPYVVEIQGFTDTTGDQSYNIDLSERRAQVVLRYLTTKYDIPLHRIHVIGLGSEKPAADNSTRDGRIQNRRVEVRIFVSEQMPQSAWWH
jgi:outer membrane protein OmpA-like peptidoglycan-associated protein